MEPGLYPSLDEATYHADPAISVSKLKRFAEAPAKVLVKRPDTPALKLGTLWHTALLEPEKLSRYVRNDDNRNSNAFKAVRERAEAEGKTVIKTAEWDEAMAMREAVLAQPVARDLLPLVELHGMVEASFAWIDGLTGLPRRGRADVVIDAPGIFMMLDLKSTEDASPRGFARKAAEYRYHWQAVSYLDGWEAATGRRPEDMVFLAIEKEAPWLVGPYTLSATDLEIAREQVTETLLRWAACEQSGVWPGYTETLETLLLPDWALRSAA